MKNTVDGMFLKGIYTFSCLNLVSMLRKESSYKNCELNDSLPLKFCSLYTYVLSDCSDLCKKYVALLSKSLYSSYRDRKTNHYNMMNSVLRNTLKGHRNEVMLGSWTWELWQIKM